MNSLHSSRFFLFWHHQQISSLVDIRKKWHISPAFSVEFIGYYLDRMDRLKEMRRNLEQQLNFNRALVSDQEEFRLNYDEVRSSIKER